MIDHNFKEIPLSVALPESARRELSKSDVGQKAIKMIELLTHQHNLLVTVANNGIQVANEAKAYVKGIEAKRCNPFSWLFGP